MGTYYPFICLICRIAVPLDDVQYADRNHNICVRCWHREVGDTIRVPWKFRGELDRLLHAPPLDEPPVNDWFKLGIFG